MVKKLADYSFDHWKKENIILINHQGEEDDASVQTFVKTYKDLMLASNDSMMYAVPTELIYGDKSFSNLKNNLNELKQNIIYIPSENQAFITSLMNQLYDIRDEYQVTLIFGDNIQTYDNIEINYLHDLNVHVLTSEYIDPSSVAVDDFKQKFYATNQHLPTKYSYLGHDVAYFYLSLMNEFGVNYDVMFLGYKKELLMLNFDYFKTGIESGYENHSVFLLKYEDYRLNKVF